MVVTEHMDLHPPLLNANTQNIKHISMILRSRFILAGTKQKFRKARPCRTFSECDFRAVAEAIVCAVWTPTYTRMHTTQKKKLIYSERLSGTRIAHLPSAEFTCRKKFFCAQFVRIKAGVSGRICWGRYIYRTGTGTREMARTCK